ncbi:hypothetical protein [Oceanobacillus jeddahense]|uniref:Uncharacterized protein n=1 Tax=Oceanobacillus jeddahense TaxID=1462527 RepID=A0ABY5JWX6_9BACI|nr:hypothetical protein [Oceanobacillus jeddahense]UUI04836.1 hypothetical protein NP439_09445 [Oceanobacillus jeddahense]
MSKRQTTALVNLLITGVVAFVISLFFAQGTIAENYTDKTFVAPEFFTILVIWGIGAIFAVIQFFKDLKPIFYYIAFNNMGFYSCWCQNCFFISC